MGGTGSTLGTVHRRETKRAPAKGAASIVVPVCQDHLKEIRIWYSAKTGWGSILFKTESGKEIWRSLVKTCLTPGKWQLTVGKGDPRKSSVASPVNVDQDLLNATLEKAKRGTSIFETSGTAKEPYDQVLHCLFMSSRGLTVPILVGWSAEDTGGKAGEKIPTTMLTDDYIHELGRQDLAVIFLALLEHFAGIAVDDGVAVGGISRDEYKELVAKPSKDPSLTVKDIARILTRAFHEIQEIKQPPNEHLVMMVSTILRQRKLKNPLAVANQLEIGKGKLRLPGGKYEDDFGLRERAKPRFLLYDKWGEAVPEYVGVADRYYRTIDLSNIAVIGVSDESGMIRALQQVFVYDNVLAVETIIALFKFSDYIAKEVYKQFRLAKVEEYVLQMLPMTIGFFVVHAIGGFLAKRGHPAGFAILAAAKAAGWVMKIDYYLMWHKVMIEAGGHFSKMEKIHRTLAGEKSKEQLTKLSRYHLVLGSTALLQGIYSAVAMKVFFVGGKLGGAAGKSIAKFVAKMRGQAAYELVIDPNGNICEIRSIRGSGSLEIPVDPVGRKVGAVGRSRSTEIRTKKGKKIRVKDRDPIDAEGGRTGGAKESTSIPKGREVVPVMQYKFKPMAEKPGTPAMETKTGIPNEVLDIAIQTAKAEGNVVLLRVGKAASVGPAKAGGYTIKGKDLIFVNSDPATGFVTVKSPAAGQMAMQRGYYLLWRDGRCYNSEANWGKPEHALKINGQTVQFQMQAEGKKFVGPNRPGQVIDPKTGKQILPDIDIQDVIRPNAQSVNAASIPLYRGEDVVSAPVRSFMNRFNKAAKQADVAAGRPPVDRIVHGGDAQFWQRNYFRNQVFKGDAVVILPDGRVAYLTEGELPGFYRSIGREVLSINSRRYQLPQAAKPRKKAPAAGPGSGTP